MQDKNNELKTNLYVTTSKVMNKNLTGMSGWKWGKS